MQVYGRIVLMQAGLLLKCFFYLVNYPRMVEKTKEME